MHPGQRKTHAYCYSWTILNLPICPIRPGKCLCSPPFTAENMGNTEWGLVLYPKGKNDSEYMSVFLQRKTDRSELKEVVIDFKITMYGLDSRFRCMNFLFNSCFQENEMVGFPEFARWDSPEMMDRTLPFEAFLIQCELSPSDKMTYDDRWNPRVDLESLSTDVIGLIEFGAYSDFVLTCQGEEFRVHRAVLMARSPKFIRDSCLRDCCTGKDMSNIPPSVLKDFLSYLYSGKLHLPLDGTQLAKLTTMATHFEVGGLLHRIRTHPKSYIARTVLQREHHTVNCGCVVLGPDDVERLSYRGGVKCAYMCFDEIFILIQVVHDCESGNGNYVNLSFVLTGMRQNRPVFLMADVNLIEGQLSTHPFLQVYGGHHVFDGDVAWRVTFPINNDPLKVGEAVHFAIQMELCDGTNASYLREEDVAFPNVCPIGLDDLRPYSRDFGALLTNAEFSDFTIYCGKEAFRVHKAILSARSPVFEKMFEHDMIEKRTGKTIIDDISPTVMWIMLTYIYTGDLQNPSIEEICDLYEASDKYALFVLHERCRSFMARNLNAGNVCDVLFLAQLHFDWDLDCSARKYIQVHNLLVEDFV